RFVIRVLRHSLWLSARSSAEFSREDGGGAPPGPPPPPGLYGLNAALAGLALALRYRSAWPPLLGMGLAVTLQPLFGLLGLPALTAPFILACLLCIGGERLYLRLAGSLGPRLGRRRS
ncbi:urea transporter, partial [Pseudomonas aeruginosa]|uniref:urea transporter n=1 Tax=Pseudomonas aeruginosa TaxID=287 RepID=UPI00300D83ED